jgi:ElaB/YqjD/DUF883 family membrane-anchored ribosome-binding protein
LPEEPEKRTRNELTTRFSERKIMSTINRPVRTKRNAADKRARANRPATERLRKQARKVTKDVQEMSGIATDAAQETLGQLRDNASEYYEQGQDKAQDVQRTIAQYIQQKPVKSVLIAAGVGLLLGRFWMRRR